MGIVFSIIGSAFGALFGAIGKLVEGILNSQRDQALGAAKQQGKVDDTSMQDVAKARAASDAANRAADADPSSLRKPDPDSRD